MAGGKCRMRNNWNSKFNPVVFERLTWTKAKNMGPVYYVISILGCADGSAQCVQAATMPVHYETEAVCRAAEADALLQASDLDFPALVAQCTAVKPHKGSNNKFDKPVEIALKG